MTDGKALPPGTIVARDWRIERKLGEGGFGITYEARHQADGRRVALKEYLPFGCGSRVAGSSKVQAAPGREGEIFAWGRERFMNEAAMLARLEHPSIVRVTNYFEANGTAYMTLGYEDGGTFGGWLRRLGRPPTQDELDNVLRPLLDALTQVHSLFLMHRDIKPENIMMRSDNTPVLIDFGTAKLALVSRTRLAADINPVVRVTLAVVTDGFSPPEQYDPEGRHQGPWTDIYALAATAYLAITGRPPPYATQRLIEDGYEPLTGMSGHANWRPAFLSGIDQALALKPQGRPQSAIELRRALGIGEATARPQRSLPELNTAATADGQKPDRTNPDDGLRAPPEPNFILVPQPPSAPRSAPPVPKQPLGGATKSSALKDGIGSAPGTDTGSTLAAEDAEKAYEKVGTEAVRSGSEVEGSQQAAPTPKKPWQRPWLFVAAGIAILGSLLLYEIKVLAPARAAKAAAAEVAQRARQAQAAVERLADCRRNLAQLPQAVGDFRIVRKKIINSGAESETIQYSSKPGLKSGTTLAENTRACAELCRTAKTCVAFDSVRDESCELYKQVNAKANIDEGDDCDYYYAKR